MSYVVAILFILGIAGAVIYSVREKRKKKTDRSVEDRLLDVENDIKALKKRKKRIVEDTSVQKRKRTVKNPPKARG